MQFLSAGKPGQLRDSTAYFLNARHCYRMGPGRIHLCNFRLQDRLSS